MKKIKNVNKARASEPMREELQDQGSFQLIDNTRKETNPFESLANTDTVRRNRSSTIERTDKYANIQNLLTPFSNTSKYGDSLYNVKDAVTLCQQAYYNFPIFTNTIELMVEFSISDIFFKGKNDKAKDFFTALFKRINLSNLQEQYFREYYRSGNIFIFRYDADLSPKDISKMTQTFGNTSKAGAKIPIKYEILNPTNVEYKGGVSYFSGIYYQELTDYQAEILRKRETEDIRAIFDSLPKETQKEIMEGNGGVLVPLSPDKIICSFYKKQDYEPFSVPMGYGVLADLNWKEELKKMDMALARTIQQVVLLITTGAEPDKGGIVPKRIEELKAIFANESIGRVLIADYTTKAEFVIPQIADILDPAKYTIVNEDIRIGLHNILVGNEKFANQSSKINLFLEKLRSARKAFLDNFIMPEIKRISEALGFKNYPTAYFEEYDLKDEVEYARIYTRLYEVGVLTPEETIRAINTGILPENEDSLESQEKLSKLRKKEQYLPMTYFQKDKPETGAKVNGRPSGTKRKQSTKKIKPLSASSIVEVSKLMSKIEANLANKLYPGKVLSHNQSNEIDNYAKTIFTNYETEQWDKVLEETKDFNTLEENEFIHKSVAKLAEEFQIDSNAATILYHSREK